MSFLNPKAVVDGESLSISGLLPTHSLIPSYQRDFAWGSKQIVQLWDDFCNHFAWVAPAETITNAQGYFLGALVAVEGPSGNAIQIVDGQQRLTTLSIMAAVLHEAIDHYAEKHPNRSAIQHALKTCWLKYDNGSFVTWIEYSDQEMNLAFFEFCVNHDDRKSRREFWRKLPKKQQKKGSSYNGVNEAFLVGYRKI